MKITIEPYTSEWVIRFQGEQAKLLQVLQPWQPSVEHIGSTSVPGLGAKPIIDILIGMANEQQLAAIILPMMAAGYSYFKKYEPLLPYRRLFVHLQPLHNTLLPSLVDIADPSPIGPVAIALANIHVLVKNTHHWNRHIAFRDYLRSHPDIKERYYQLKKTLSARTFRDTLEYNDAKSSFVKSTEQQALDWWLQKNNSLH